MSSDSKQPSYCYLDLDLDNHRSKLGFAAAFVDATDTRYGFTSKDLRLLGGSEVSRINDLIQTDHEWSSRVSSSPYDGKVETRGPSYGGRIIVKLYWDVAPLACENFVRLCCHYYPQCTPSNTNNKKKIPPVPIGQCGKPLTYKNCILHRIVPGFVMQGGDFVFGNGSGGESTFQGGKKFKDERAGLLRKHDMRGVLSMGNSGKNSNSSQFFITFGPTEVCDGKHVVFGHVVSGFQVMDAAEKVGTSSGNPSVPVTITDCGIYHPFASPGNGYWFDQPDRDSFAGSTPVFMCRPRVAVLAPTKAVLKKFHMALRAAGAACECLIAVDAASDSGEGTLIKMEEEEYEQQKEVVVGPAKEYAEKLLMDHVVEVVLVAPACSSSSPTMPASWFEESFDFNDTGGEKVKPEEVISVTKPAECKEALRSSWIKYTDWCLEE